MPLTSSVQRGHTFNANTPWDTDDLNAAALPVVVIEGAVGASDIGAGAVNPQHVAPGAYFYGVSSGAANSYAVTLTPAATALTAGLYVAFKAHAANTGAASLSVNGLTAAPLITGSGQALTGGEIIVGQVVEVRYDGTSFQIVSERSLPKTLYSVGGGAANAHTVTLPGVTVSAISQLLGQEIIFKAIAANTGATTLAVNGLAPVAITKQGSSALEAGDIQTGGMVSVSYDGTSFQMTSFMAAAPLPSVGATGTVTYPYSLEIDPQGRVINKSGGVYSGTAALPAKGSAATFTHGLSRTPAFVAVKLMAGGTPEHGYSAGDEVPVGQIYSDVSDADNNYPSFIVSWNATSVTVGRVNQNEYIHSKTGSSTGNALDGSKWTLNVVAW